MSRTLAIDYGRSRIGVAVSAGTLAEPLEVISPKDAPVHLRQIVEKFDVSQLVVGVSEKNMAQESRKFGADLATQLNLPVFFTDETLSSVEVQKRLRSTRIGKKQYRGPIDHFAAAIILERYLEDHSKGFL
jgi:putative Holliday junction resolvase